MKRSPLSVETDSSFPVATRVFAGVTLGLFLFVGAGGWAGTPQLTGAVIAPGMVKVDQNMKSIQHRDGGIVSEIAVKEGISSRKARSCCGSMMRRHGQGFRLSAHSLWS